MFSHSLTVVRTEILAAVVHDLHVRLQQYSPCPIAQHTVYTSHDYTGIPAGKNSETYEYELNMIHLSVAQLQPWLMAQPEKRARLAQSLSRTSASKLWKLQQINEGKDVSKPASGAFKRECAKALEPCLQCFEQIGLGPVRFWVAHLGRLVQFACDRSEQYKQAMLEAPQQLGLVWYTDECTGGNVLATSQQKRACMYYIAFQELGGLSRPQSWLPLACIPSLDFAMIPGGFSAVSRRVAKHLQPWLTDGLHVLGRHYGLSVRAILGDYDALADLFQAKGASGVKPCLLCQNCVSKRQKETLTNHEYFRSITCFKFGEFQQYCEKELHEIYEHFLQIWPDMTAGAKEEAERQLGFSVCPLGVLACPLARATFSLGKVCLDTCHIYFSNGICDKELLLLQQAFSKKTSSQLSDVQRKISEDAWRCSSKNFAAPYATKKLFWPSFWNGQFYKGEASAVWFLLPLFFHHAYTFGADVPEIRSMEALLEVVSVLKSLRNGAGPGRLADLLPLQEKHLHLFKAAYGESTIIPKHHLALHLSKCFEAVGGYMDCFPTEARHQIYKGLCDDLEQMLQPGTGEFGLACSHRILNRAFDSTVQLWQPRLQGRVFDESLVKEVLGTGCKVATSYSCGSVTLRGDQVVFFGSAAGIGKYFAQKGAEFYMFYEVLHERAAMAPNTREFLRSGDVEPLRLKEASLWFPTWHRRHQSGVTCLL